MEMPAFDIFDVGGWLFKFMQFLCWSFTGGCCDLINEMLDAVTGMEIFTLSLGSPELNPVWQFSTSVAQTVAMPLAYSILGIMVGLELLHATQEMGRSKFAGIEVLGRFAVKVLVVKVIIDHAPAFMRGLYDLTVWLSRGIQSIQAPGGSSELMPKEQMQGIVEAIQADQAGMILLFFLIMLVAVVVVFGACVFVQMIALARYVEIFVFIAFAALPLVMFANSELKARGVNFLTGYLSICLQGTVLVFLIKVMTPLFSAVATILSGMLGDTAGATGIEMFMTCVAPLALCLAMITVVQHSREIAGKITGGY